MSGVVGEPGEDVGEPGARIDVIEFACLGQRQGVSTGANPISIGATSGMIAPGPVY
jgi:hypothetical protein